MNNFYEKHMFFCINQKDNGKKCCQNADAKKYFDYTKEKLQAMDLWGPGKVRVSSSGCLGRCAIGPALVIYPEAVWYTYASFADIDHIVNEHILQNTIVQSLLMAAPESNATQ